MLRWNGKGIVYGIPARDLTDEEVKEYGGEAKLLRTGLYEKMETPRPSNKLQKPNSENKEKL